MSNEHNSPQESPTSPNGEETAILPRVEAPAFRELVPGEIIQETDEVFAHGKGPWGKVDHWTIGLKWEASAFHPIRRPIPLEPSQAPVGSKRKPADDRMSEEDRQEFGPNGRPAPSSMWMADSRPLLAEIESLRAQLDALNTPAPVPHGERAKDIDAIHNSLRHLGKLELYSLDLQAMKTAEAALYRLRMAPYEPPAETTAQVSTLQDALAKAREALNRSQARFESIKLRLEKEAPNNSDLDAVYTEAKEGWIEGEAALESPSLAQVLKGGGMSITTRPATDEEKIQIAKINKMRAEWARRNVLCDGAHPKCPYCKVEHTKVSARSIADDLDFSQGDDGVDGEDEVCAFCERPFKLKVEFTIEWETSMTDEEFAIEEAKRPDPNQITIFPVGEEKK